MTLAFVPVIAWRVITVSRLLRPVWLKVQQLIAALGTTLQESLTGIRVVKDFARGKGREPRNSKLMPGGFTIHRLAPRAWWLSTRRSWCSCSSAPTALVLWYGGRQVIAGSLTIGGMTQFVLYISMLAMPIRRLGA